MTSTRPDLSVSVPAGWRRRSDPDRGVLVVARATRTPASGVPPELVVRCVPVTDDLPTWRGRALAQLAGRLDDFDLEDEDAFELDGRPVAYHRFAHRGVVADLLSEQWTWVVDGRGITLTGTVARDDYADYCEVFEAVAETLDPGRVTGRDLSVGR